MPSAWVIRTMRGGCQSVMNPGWVSVCTADGPQLGGAGADPLVVDVEVGAHALERVDGRDHAVLVAAADAHLAARHEPGHQVAEGLEAVALQVGGARRSATRRPR